MDDGFKKRKYHFHPWRTIVPALFTLVFLLLVWRLSYPLPAGSDWLIRLSRLDPILLVAQLRWERSIPAWIWLPD